MDNDATPTPAPPAESLDEAWCRALIDLDAVRRRVSQRLDALATGADTLRFFRDYASWNGSFANGVAALSSLIGSERDLFREPGFPRAVSDRSNYIASFFFEAARDEYDDHVNPERDSHRCMAQASLIAMKDFFGLPDEMLDSDGPESLKDLVEDVLIGYTGHAAGAQGEVAQVFAAIGYHLGSELLADQEFSLLDEHMRRQRNDLVQHLMRTTVKLAGATHRCWAWVGVHSGHGGAVEADHFAHALNGAQLAVRFLAEGSAEEAMAAIAQGFRRFDADHARFFALG